MTQIPDSLPVLGRGSHDSPQIGTCVMEYISMLTGGRFTDLPDCTEPSVAILAQAINDDARQDERQELLALVPRLLAAKPLPDLPPGYYEMADYERRDIAWHRFYSFMFSEPFYATESRRPVDRLARILDHYDGVAKMLGVPTTLERLAEPDTLAACPIPQEETV